MMGKLNDLLTSIISKVNASVKTEAQTLTDEQKAQARSNIGAAAEGGGGGVQPDWNQTDESQPDFIKNKPFGDFLTVLFDDTIIIDETEGAASFNLTNAVSAGDVLNVEWDGIEYKCEVVTQDAYLYFGNPLAVGGDDTGEPFGCVCIDTYAQVLALDLSVTSVPLKIVGISVGKLKQKYFDSCVTLYTDMADDSRTYLYTDVSLSQKLTSSELKTLLGFPIVVRVVSFGISLPDWGSDYALSIGFDGEIGFLQTSTKKHYTAEYTPETT